MTSQKVKNLRTGIFIDGSNLLWAMMEKNENGQKKNYNICFKKLKEFLKDKYSPVFYNYYVCVDTKPLKEPYIDRAVRARKFHNFLEGVGYNVKKKDLKVLKCGDTKCDTDVEIVMDLHKHSNDIDNIVIFSGDSDFKSAIEGFHQQGKHIRIYSFRSSLSWELKDFSIKNTRCNFNLLDELQDKLERN